MEIPCTYCPIATYRWVCVVGEVILRIGEELCLPKDR